MQQCTGLRITQELAGQLADNRFARRCRCCTQAPSPDNIHWALTNNGKKKKIEIKV